MCSVDLLKPTGSYVFLSFLTLHSLSFLPMAQNLTPVTRSSLEQDYGYDIANDVFLFYPSRPAFESSRDSLFPPVRSGISPRISRGDTNHSASIPPASTTFRCSEMTGSICRYHTALRRYVYAPRRPKTIIDPHQSVYSDYTATTCVDEDLDDTGEGVLRSMGYSRCFCLGLFSVGTPHWSHSATAQDYTPDATQDRTSTPLGNFFAKLWNKFLRR